MKAVKLVSFVACGAVGLISSAETLTWTGAGGMTWDASTQSWKDAGGSDTSWVEGSDALFNGSGTGAITLASGLTARTLTFDGAGAAYRFNDSEMLVTEKLVTVTNGATFTLNSTLNRKCETQYQPVTFNVSKGSALNLLMKGIESTGPVFNIDGGTFCLNNQAIYVQNLNLSNGALVTDPTDGDGYSATFRMGCYKDRPCVRSYGPVGATNELRANVTVWDKYLPDRAGTDYRLMLDVGDQPLLVTGRFFAPGESDYWAHRIDKIGPGTLIMRCNSLTESGTTFSGTRPNVLTAAVHVVEGVMRVEKEKVFRGKNQTIVVESGARLDLITGQQNCYLTVLTNGIARMIGSKVLGASQVTIDGGSVQCAQQNNFLCDVTLRNGGVIEEAPENGSSLRFGQGGTGYKYPTIRSEGSVTNEIRNFLRFYRYDGNTEVEAQAIILDVEAPLRLGGAPHIATDAGYDTKHVWKTGSGELILDYEICEVNACANGLLTVKEGSVRLARTMTMKYDRDQSLAFWDKTALAVNAGMENSVKKATFAGEVTLDVGEGAKLTFVDYDLSGMTRLNVPSTIGARGLRFGTTKCLTDAELAKFRCRGYLFEQDDDGYVHPRKKGLVLLFR